MHKYENTICKYASAINTSVITVIVTGAQSSLSVTLGLVDQTILKLPGKGNQGQFPGNRGRDVQNKRTRLSGEEEKLERCIYNKIRQTKMPCLQKQGRRARKRSMS